MPIVALVGAGIGAIGTAISSRNQRSAVNEAQASQERAAQLGIEEQRRQYDVTRADNLPFLTAGQDALAQQRGLVGLNGAQEQQAGIDQLRSGPLYESLYRNGEQSALANASATGGLRGGNTQRSLYNLGNDTLSQAYQYQLANLGGLAGQGQQSGVALGNFGQNTANAVQQGFDAQGNAQAQGALTRGAINSAQTQNLFSSIGQFFPTPGAGIGGNLPSALSGIFRKQQQGQQGQQRIGPVF